MVTSGVVQTAGGGISQAGFGLRAGSGRLAGGGGGGGATSRGLCPAGPSSVCRGYQCALVSGRANVRVEPLGVRQTDGGLGKSQPSFGIRARPWALGTRVGPYVRGPVRQLRVDAVGISLYMQG